MRRRYLVEDRNDSRFVAVGSKNSILTSPDGFEWTPQESGIEGSVFSIAFIDITYHNNLFVAIGVNDGSSIILTSPDGVIWTQRLLGFTISPMSIKYCNNLFIITGYSGTILTSPDAITWTNRNIDIGFDFFLSNVTYGNGLFVAVGNSGVNCRILTSPDGVTWTQRSTGVNKPFMAITYGNGLFVAVGAQGLIPVIITSPDAINWSVVPDIEQYSVSFQDIIYANGLFVAVGIDQIFTSPDGMNWTRKLAGINISILSITYKNGLYVAAGYGPSEGGIIVSTDTDYWTLSYGGIVNSGYLRGITSR